MPAIINFKQDFNVPAQKVFEFFCNHHRLGEIWDGRFQRIKDSADPDNINGEGSVRLITLPFLSFEETVTKAIPPNRIEYTISKRSPLKNHYGVMKFIDMDNGRSRLDYQIEFDSKIPFTNGLLKLILRLKLGKGIRLLAIRFSENPDY